MRKTPDFYATFLHHCSQTKPPTFLNADGFRIYENCFVQIYKLSTNPQIWNTHIRTFTPSDIARNLNLNVYGNGKRKARNNQQVLR